MIHDMIHFMIQDMNHEDSGAAGPGIPGDAAADRDRIAKTTIIRGEQTKGGGGGGGREDDIVTVARHLHSQNASRPMHHIHHLCSTRDC